MSPRVQELQRELVEACIEQLIALLDILDGDPDLEDNGDFEPSIGSQPLYVAGQLVDDLEVDDSDCEPNGDELDFNGCWGEYGNGSGLRQAF
ncbi:hypothetical protein HJB67_01870 [Rhizobium lentis]|uniref:hypothetical protein n=1 Tax=Rhizobium lentis TaxID=1138194 RepID=UPI001C828961|nr:hypothetical protein [Rhizobium lentis]MBX5008738.1 hypothetical protein [Rhizobium lentis]